VINITDDGIGGASLAKGHGLSGLADRLAGVDGTLTVSSPAGGPTQLTATIPQLP
jgi:signal transduction histidine kinase